MKKTLTHNSQTPITYINNTSIFDAVENRLFAGNYSATIIVPHVCNNTNHFGAGFAFAVSEKYPIVKENFHMLGNKAKLGKVQYVIANQNKTHRTQLIFANMIAQNRTIGRDNPRPLNYAALVSCMIDIKKHAENLTSNSESDKIEIHCPKFGSGLAGGNWNFISDLIIDIWSDFSVFVYSPTMLTNR